jgi:RNA polymerase-binding transcription factor DksA
MDADNARHQLQSERDRLEGLRAGFDGERLHDESSQESLSELSHLSIHGADGASETFEREKDFTILEQIERELGEIDRALVRLDEGTYGRCEACRDPIDDERLAALPFARYCRAHQETWEVTPP